ncbi:MAG TPA: hypothetical protein VFX48_00475, partial [Saprospiraceae bacterium]|nr:hypothetical protein [Saprospiraceae bacterium]
MKPFCLSFLSLFLFLNLTLHAQPATGNTTDALVKSGDEQIEKGQYYRALEQYEKAYKEVKDKDIAIKIAYTHLLLRDYPKASNWYNRVLARDKANKYASSRYYFGKALKMNGQYTEAAEEFKKYLEGTPDEAL